MIPISVAINELGVSPSSIYEYIKNGVVTGKKINGQMFIDKELYEQNLVPYYTAKKKKRLKKEQRKLAELKTKTDKNE